MPGLVTKPQGQALLHNKPQQSGWMSFTNLTYFIVIARENLQNLFQQLLNSKKLPNKSLPMEETIKLFYYRHTNILNVFITKHKSFSLGIYKK